VLFRDGRAVGRLRYGDPELTEALNLADADGLGRQRRLAFDGSGR